MAALGSVRVSNPIPATFARVVSGHETPPTLGRPGDVDAFVTDATAVRGLNANEISAKLGIPESATGYRVIEFPSSSVRGVASPINRTNPGFVGRGVTSGGAPEYVVPNGLVPEGSVITDVPPMIEPGPILEIP
jgi:hypothetical protein